MTDICPFNKSSLPDSEAATSLTKLHLLARHTDISKGAAGPAGGVGAFSRMVLGGYFSTQGLQLRLVAHLQSHTEVRFFFLFLQRSFTVENNLCAV